MMDIAVYQSPPAHQIIRDARGLILGRIERQVSTGRFIARDARGLLVGAYDPREGTTRNARGLVVARGDVLAALLVRR